MASQPALPRTRRWSLRSAALAAALSLTAPLAAQVTSTNAVTTNAVSLVAKEGTASVKPTGTPAAIPAPNGTVLKPGDTVATGPNSRALAAARPLGVVRAGPDTEFAVGPAKETGRWPIIEVLRGMLFFFSREKAVDAELRTGMTSAASKGTEFAVMATEAGRMEIIVIDGEVELSNPQGKVTVGNFQRGVAEPGQAPFVEAAPAPLRAIDWVLHYPTVLCLDDLEWSADDQAALTGTLAAYRSGDIPRALALYPTDRRPTTAAEAALRATLLLAVGETRQAQSLLAAWPEGTSVMAPVRQLLAAVWGEPGPPEGEPGTASAWMAQSYRLQARALTDPGALRQARHAAERAVERAPESGLAWARLAELEFAFGATSAAEKALERALEKSPQSAAALALRGFVLAAENRRPEAEASFEQAMAVDPSLATAWLGRGLMRIRGGDLAGGQEDLLIAAALEPQRAMNRNYLGKSFAERRDAAKAERELELAQRLDPGDPTSWLYLALVQQSRNEINDAIDSLEQSKARNDNRSLYRSSQLLDQDRAVRSANLARIFLDAAMPEVAYREAVQAVNSDYANYSAHLFLANSFEDRRDPRLFGLRYETAANTEYLLANLLAPVGAGTLSPSVSQQEYSKLFERNRLGVTSQTEYRSGGDWIQSGAQFGVFGNTGYSIEGYYRSENGDHPNGDLEVAQVSLQLKQQLTAADSVYLQASWLDHSSGDVAPRWDPANASPTFRATEQQEPLISLGYHREWRPGMHTLVLAGILRDKAEFGAATWPIPLAVLDTFSARAELMPFPLTQSYQSRLELYSIEAQQLWEESDRHDSILGVRYQWGEMDPFYTHSNPQDWQAYFPAPQSGRVDGQLDRVAAYAYHRWEVIPRLWLQGGVAYERLEFPAGFLYPPLKEESQTEEQVSPKVGVVWQPLSGTTLRGAWARSLSGASLEQSYRLEPTQLAGFTQAYRGVIPEAAAGGPTPGASYDVAGVALEQRLKTRTYLGLTAEMLTSESPRWAGAYQFDPVFDFQMGQTLYQTRLDFTERSLEFTANQLIGSQWSVGVRYRLTQSELDLTPNGFALPVGAAGPYRESVEATLHQVTLVGAFNHRCGFFARAEGSWYHQVNSGYTPSLPDEDLWQLNLFAGYRFARRQAELGVGILNLTDEDYRLNPLSMDFYLPRERTLAVRLRLNF